MILRVTINLDNLPGWRAPPPKSLSTLTSAPWVESASGAISERSRVSTLPLLHILELLVGLFFPFVFVVV